MLKTQEIIERLDLIDREQYGDMIRQVNIPDFYKCIAQFSGLDICKVSDDAIVEYLTTWCKHKHRFFKMLGNKVRLDQRFSYKRNDKDMSEAFNDLGKQFPAYYLWLKQFRNCTKNKIDCNTLDWQLSDTLKNLFPQFNIVGSTLTHFFKSKLTAPDELVTKIGRIFENDTIEATHTISIDPVDMMLASENPYDWNSCYRLELDRSDSHADGCLAAVLDTTSLITYVWEHEGEYNMYDAFKFKKIRYYRMRGWIAIAEGFKAIHFSSVYPGRGGYDDDFFKQLRVVVEKVVANHAGVADKWKKNEYMDLTPEGETGWRQHDFLFKCHREFYYGYSEFQEEDVWYNTELNPKRDTITKDNFKQEYIKPYDTKIVCPCGCGNYLMGSDECVDECDEGWVYNGEGFVCENYYENEPSYKWCPYRDCECSCGCYEDDECDFECETYQDNNPKCSLELGYYCEDPDYEMVENGVMPACEGNCESCWMWKRHQEKKEEKEEKDSE